MREILELQTGQVAFISGLMSGFALSVAAHVLRYGLRSRAAQLVFLMFLVSSLLFLVALYIDVRLSIELSGHDSVPAKLLAEIAELRRIGTSCATVALCMFVAAAGLLGWLASTATGLLSSLIAAMVMGTLWYVWQNINTLSTALSNL